MKTLSQLWTGAIAYVSLLVGAGLSIMYNILDTMQVRGHAFDWADLITAIAAPGIVVLMVEMFVSRIWLGTTGYVQVIRWLACMAIGGVAMRTSWTHGHDWMASRGQATDVATLWPLAIDLLAILATALILAGRRGSLATGQVAKPEMATGQVAKPEMATGQVAKPEMATEEYGQWPDEANQVANPDRLATQPDDPTIDIREDLARWNRGYEEAIDDMAKGIDVVGEAERVLTGTPPAKPENIPADAADLIISMQGLNARPGEIDQAVAEMSGKSTRVARRWRIALKSKEG